MLRYQDEEALAIEPPGNIVSLMNWAISQPRSLTEAAVERLRMAIIEGELALGEKLSEQMLADRFQISRSPVRDALALLQSQGLVKVYPKRGSFVFSPVLPDVEDLCEYRSILEAAAVRLVIERAQAETTETLERLNKKMSEAMEVGDKVRFTKCDLAFHNTIIANSGNNNLAHAYDRMIGPVLALRNNLFIGMNEVMDLTFDEHREITDLIQLGDAAKAASILSQHIHHIVEAYRNAEWRRDGASLDQ